MPDAPPLRGDWVMDLVARKPREVLGSVVHAGYVVKIWYRLGPNQIRALFPGQFRKLKKSEPRAVPQRSRGEVGSASGTEVRKKA